jgi:hypothetical protein
MNSAVYFELALIVSTAVVGGFHCLQAVIRLGCVALLLGIVGYVEPKPRVPGRAMHSLAQESLIIYFVHICILYGSTWDPGIRQWIGPTLAPLSALG